MTELERRWRDALITAVIARETPDLDDFWARFDALAPPILKTALRVAVVTLGALPILRYGRPLEALHPDQRDAFLVRAHAVPGLGQLVDAAKIVACLAHFRGSPGGTE